MSCPICGGAGYVRRDVPVNHPEFGRAIPCRCKKQETLPALQRWSGLGNSTQAWTLEDFPGDRAALKAAKEALAQKHGIWVFWSQAFGTGKTGILVSMVQACWQANLPALYQSVPAMLDRLRASYAEGDYDTLMNELKQVPVLALDEFHRWHNKRNSERSRLGDEDKSEGSHSWAEEKIFQIVEDRYIHWDERMTLIATNRNPDKGDLDPIASRFSDSLRSRVIHVGGGDLRPHARELDALSRLSLTEKQPA